MGQDTLQRFNDLEAARHGMLGQRQNETLQGLILKINALQDPAVRSAIGANPETLGPTFGLPVQPAATLPPDQPGPTAPARVDLPPKVETKGDIQEALLRAQTQAALAHTNYQNAFVSLFGGGMGGGLVPGHAAPAGVPAETLAAPAVGRGLLAVPAEPSTAAPGPSGRMLKKLTASASGGSAEIGYPDRVFVEHGTIINGKPITGEVQIGDKIYSPKPPKATVEGVRQAGQARSALEVLHELKRQLQSPDPEAAQAAGRLGSSMNLTLPRTMMPTGLAGLTLGKANHNPMWENYISQGGAGNTPAEQKLMETFGYYLGTGYQPLLAGGRGSKQIIEQIQKHFPAPWRSKDDNLKTIEFLTSRYGDKLANISVGSGGGKDLTAGLNGAPPSRTEGLPRKKGLRTTTDLERELVDQYAPTR